MQNYNWPNHLSGALRPRGLYDPRFEHDACGVGMVCHMKGEKSHRIIVDGLQILVNLTHRGACGCDETTGDGAGILMQMPHAFLQKVSAEASIKLPAEKEYACGLVFLPRDQKQRQICMDHLRTGSSALCGRLSDGDLRAAG
jgi:glutamate synthase (NADPH/NADH) large chain